VRDADEIAHYYNKCDAQAYLARVAAKALRDAKALPGILRRVEEFAEQAAYTGD
jgi:hypothetical protein